MTIQKNFSSQVWSILSLDFGSSFFTDFGISILLFSCALIFSFPLTLAVDQAISAGQRLELFMVFNFLAAKLGGGLWQDLRSPARAQQQHADGFPSTCLVSAGRGRISAVPHHGLTWLCSGASPARPLQTTRAVQWSRPGPASVQLPIQRLEARVFPGFISKYDVTEACSAVLNGLTKHQYSKLARGLVLPGLTEAAKVPTGNHCHSLWNSSPAKPWHNAVAKVLWKR